MTNPRLAGAQPGGCRVRKDVNVGACLRKSATSCAVAERLCSGRTALRKWILRLHGTC